MENWEIQREFNGALQEAYSAKEDLEKMKVISAYMRLSNIIDLVAKLRDVQKASTDVRSSR